VLRGVAIVGKATRVSGMHAALVRVGASPSFCTDVWRMGWERVRRSNAYDGMAVNPGAGSLKLDCFITQVRIERRRGFVAPMQPTGREVVGWGCCTVAGDCRRISFGRSTVIGHWWVRVAGRFWGYSRGPVEATFCINKVFDLHYGPVRSLEERLEGRTLRPNIQRHGVGQGGGWCI